MTTRLFTTLVALVLLLALVTALAFGPVPVSPRELGIWLLHWSPVPLPQLPRHIAIVLGDIRLPRVLMGLMTGASLAMAGAAIQGLFRNPLADPGLIGVSSGAALAALAVGAGVSVAGMIGFVGLVVPHLVRLALGPDHRALIPLSGLVGAALLVWADILARLLVAPAELPTGRCWSPGKTRWLHRNLCLLKALTSPPVDATIAP